VTTKMNHFQDRKSDLDLQFFYK